MSVSIIIEQILSEWAYRVNDGMPNPKNPTHLRELGIILSEMGLSSIKSELIENLLVEKGKTPEKHVIEADGAFKNPILNKSVKYKNAKGEDADGLVGNLLRLPAEHPGRKAAERLLPPEGSDERDALNKDLGGQNQPQGAEPSKGDKGGEEEGAPQEDPIQKAAQMFDPKVDPAMAQRLETEKETLAKLAGTDDDKTDKEEPKEENEFNPIPSADVRNEIPEADPETFGGGSDIPDGIGKDDLNKFNTDISKVQQIVADAKAKGEKAPNINLCQITVPGTNLYCDNNLGIPREEMPQFKGTAQPGTRASNMPVDKSGEVDTEPVFREMLKEKGIKVTQTEVPADKLKATQSELVGAKVVGMMGALEENPEHDKITAPIYVSRDGYVIDGHHRWAAIAAYNAKYPDKQIPMKVQVLDQDIKDAIPMANKFAEDMGIAAKKADANKETPSDVKTEPKKTEEVVSSLKNRKTEDGEELDLETTENGSMIIGVEHGEGTESTKETINQITSLPKDTKVMFVGEGGMTNDDVGNIDFTGEQKQIRDAVKGHFDNAEESSWDENANVFDSSSPVFDEVSKSLGGSKSKSQAAIWSNMVGQGDDLDPNDYLDEEGKTWLIDQAKKGGSGEFEGDVDWSNLSDTQKEDLYQLNFRDDDGYGETEISKAQEAYNSFRQKELDRKIKEAESQGYKVIAPVGNSHVDMWRKRNKNEQIQMKEELLPLIDKMIGQIIEGFIEEATPKQSKEHPGYFHRGGGYYSKQADGEITHKSDAGALRKLTAKEKKEKNKKQPTITQQPVGKKLGAGDFRQTKDVEPARDTTPTQTEPQDKKPSTKRKKKNKELNQTVNTKNNFNKGYFAEDGVSDKDFNGNPKVKKTANQIKINDVIPYFVDKSGKTNFPKKYLKVLTRLLNTKGGTGLSISDFTDASGAGTLPSTMGELMTMMAVTIKDENKANEFFQKIMAHVKSNGKDSIIDPGWVKSAQLVRQTMFKRFDRQYGKGKWELDNMAWDIESEVEGLGLENYKDNKGFSTDVYAKVKVDGKYVLDEVSLKKELKANLLNATSGRVQDIMVRGLASDEDLRVYDDLNSKLEALAPLKDSKSKEEKKQLAAQRDAIVEKYNAKVPDNVKVSYAQKKQREMHQDYIKNGEKEVKQFLNKFCSKDKKFRQNAANLISTQLNQKGNFPTEVTGKIDAVCKSVRLGQSYGEALIGLEKSDYQKLNLGIMSYIASTDNKSKAAKSYKAIIDNSHAHSKAVRDFLLKDPNARKGLFASIREDFPLKALFEGEENMILGDVSADRQVLQDVFQVSSFEELEQKLVIRDTPPPPSIVYRVKGREDISVAEIKSRPDGIGYGGTWKLEMAVHPDFGRRLKESNAKLNK
jgi:hypothetical protein